MHPSKLALGSGPTVAHFLRPSSIEGHPIYYGPKSNAFIRQAFQRDDQVEREKGWKIHWESESGEGEGRGRGRQGKKRCAYGRVKKEDETSRCRRMACYDRVLFLSYEKLPEESYQEPFSTAGRSPHARSLPTLSTNGYL